MPGEPRVAILVLNLNGREHLTTCLPSLDAQVYPNRVIVVVDNGSSDGSLDYVTQHHPTARQIALGSNHGFCGAYNRAVREVDDADLVVFLNNDTRVDPGWLGELLTVRERHAAAAVGSRMLTWDGSADDFDGGVTSFLGHSWQVGRRALSGEDEGQVLFACGGSMLADRRVFLAAGGFDERYFAYFEDVDLGWRLSVLGHRVVFAPRALTYHRLHGTVGPWAYAPRLRLYERNALFTVFKNYEPESLRCVLPAAVALALARALDAAALPADAFVLGQARVPPFAGMSSAAAAALMGLEDFATALPDLVSAREAIQRSRQRTDRELFALFGEPLRLHGTDSRYLAAAQALIEDLGINALIGSAHPQAFTPYPPPTPQQGIAPHHSSANSTAQSIARSTVHTSHPALAGTVPPDLGANSVGNASSLGLHRPSVSVVIPTMLGTTHLPACLQALAAQDYPAEQVTVIIVDNGGDLSLDGLVANALRQGRVLRPGRNLGFAAANNLGFHASTSDYVAFLNDDTRAEPGWLARMIEVAERRQAACVGALIVDWDGMEIDFAGGLVNFEGKGFQEQIAQPVDGVPQEERPILFANGAGMLVRSDVLRDSGGWDEGTFAYYEDVELGWRLWLLGHEVWFAPQAIVRHRHHGTSGRWPAPPRVRLLERNALRMIYALLETSRLGNVLPAALLLAADRAFLQSALHRGATDDGSGRARAVFEPLPARARRELRHRGARKTASLATNLRTVGLRGMVGAAVDTLVPTWRRLPSGGSRRDYRLESGPQRRRLDGRLEPLTADGAARLLGIKDFLDDLPELSVRRAWLQARRARSDAEILSRFGGRWLATVPSPHQGLHDALHATLVEVLGIPVRQGDQEPGSPLSLSSH